MAGLLVGIQLLGTFVAFGLIIYIFRSKASEPQKVLFAGSIFIYIDMLGYYFELTSKTMETVLLAIKMEYIGNTLGSLLFIFFICIYSPKRRYRAVKIIFLINNLFILLLVLTVSSHALFYSNITLHVSENITFVELQHGFFYHWWRASSALLNLFAIGASGLAYKEHKNKKHPEYGLIFATSFIPLLAWPLNALRVFGLFDFFPLILLITTGCLALIVSKYRLSNTVLAAKDRLIDELEEGIIVYDSDDYLAYYNKETVNIFPELEVFDKETAQQMIENILVKNEDGFFSGKHFFQWKRNLLFDEHNRFIGQILRVIDDTETYEYTRKLIELKNDAEKANRAKSIFLTRMSHEIRTPLNAILGMDELILQENTSDEINGYAGDIKDAGKLLLSLIDDILDLSKIESGKLEILPVNYELNSLLYNIYTMISMKAEKKGLVLDYKIDETIPNGLFGDEIRIKQCLTNLLTNSVKYTKRGKISLKIFGEKGVDDNTILLKVSVSDTGIGIHSGDLERIFNSFERVDYQKNKGVEGTGLGLNITRELVTMMGGTLEVESVYGEGSTFQFAILQEVQNAAPIGKINLQASPNTAPHVSPYQFSAPGARILIVDDTAVNISIVKGLLKKCDIQIDKALSGAECLDKVSKNYYDIILMDHMMPGMDGIETFKKLRKMNDCKCPNSPCIALTANAIYGSKEHYIAEGFTDYLSKPIEIDELYKQLIQYLPPELIHYPINYSEQEKQKQENQNE